MQRSGEKGALKELRNVSLILLGLFRLKTSSWVHIHMLQAFLICNQNKTSHKNVLVHIALLVKCMGQQKASRRRANSGRVKTGPWSEAESCQVAELGSRSQCPWPAGCARTERIASHPLSPLSSHPARSHPATRLKQTKTTSQFLPFRSSYEQLNP